MRGGGSPKCSRPRQHSQSKKPLYGGARKLAFA